MILSWGSGVSGQALFVVYLDNEATRFSTTRVDVTLLPPRISSICHNIKMSYASTRKPLPKGE